MKIADNCWVIELSNFSSITNMANKEENEMDYVRCTINNEGFDYAFVHFLMHEKKIYVNENSKI